MVLMLYFYNVGRFNTTVDEQQCIVTVFLNISTCLDLQVLV